MRMNTTNFAGVELADLKPDLVCSIFDITLNQLLEHKNADLLGFLASREYKVDLEEITNQHRLEIYTKFLRELCE